VSGASIEYRAFLSYSHRDTAWGKWLHRALEGYRIDKDLVGRETRVGSVPRTLRPIFRDREDFSAGHSLAEQTIAALEASKFLIVICSPNAAQSKYVNEEVRRFKMLGGAERVLPVIVDGEPGDPARECFPPALRCKVGADGEISEEREEPIAADARAQGDGKEIARQKVVAGLFGLGLDEIVRRAERARRRRNRFWAALAGVFLVLAVAASGSAAYAWQQLKTNEAFLNATLKRATGIVDEAVAQAEKYKVPRTATLRMLAGAEGLFEDMAQYGRPTPELRYRKAWMSIQFARNYAILGDTGKQFARANQALDLLASLAAEKPNDVTYQRDLSIAHDEIGDVLKTQGNWPEALQAYRQSLAIRERLAHADSENTAWQFDLIFSYQRIGDVELELGHLAEAANNFSTRHAILARLTAQEPNDTQLQWLLADSYLRLGRVHEQQGNLAGAFASYQTCREIMEQLANTDPDNGGWQFDLAFAYRRIGEVEFARGHLNEAAESYAARHAILSELAAKDPTNARWQYEFAISHEAIGDAYKWQSKLADAFAAYTSYHDIMDRLTKGDPKNTDWQYDLAYSYRRMGEVDLARGQLPQAANSFAAWHAILSSLVAKDPANARWKWELATSHGMIGYVQELQGDLIAALASDRAYRDLMQGLVKADPTNAGKQFDLSFAFMRLGDVLARQAKLDEALAAYRENLSIRERLAAADRTNAQWQNALKVSIRKVGSIAFDFILARDFGKALDAAEQAVSRTPDQIWINVNRAHALMFLGRLDEARALYLRYRGEKKVQGDKSWEAVVIEDFAGLRKAGLTHPLMDEIGSTFATSG
jgi:tetratricopeptide (TPR) repeat protein